MNTLSVPQRSVLALLRLYQRTLSPETGWFSYRYPYGVCRFYPRCSEYAVQAVAKAGVVRGLFAATRRVLRCHPWQTGGFDPVH